MGYLTQSASNEGLNAFIEDRDACLASGMDDFITKPVVPDRLYEILLKWLSQEDR